MRRAVGVPLLLTLAASLSACEYVRLLRPGVVRLVNHLPLVPDHTLRAGAAIMLPRALQLGMDARYTGEQWLRRDEANQEEPLEGGADNALERFLTPGQLRIFRLIVRRSVGGERLIRE